MDYHWGNAPTIKKDFPSRVLMRISAVFVVLNVLWSLSVKPGALHVCQSKSIHTCVLMDVHFSPCVQPHVYIFTCLFACVINCYKQLSIRNRIWITDELKEIWIVRKEKNNTIKMTQCNLKIIWFKYINIIVKYVT